MLGVTTEVFGTDTVVAVSLSVCPPVVELDAVVAGAATGIGLITEDAGVETCKGVAVAIGGVVGADIEGVR